MKLIVLRTLSYGKPKLRWAVLGFLPHTYNLQIHVGTLEYKVEDEFYI